MMPAEQCASRGITSTAALGSGSGFRRCDVHFLTVRAGVCPEAAYFPDFVVSRERIVAVTTVA